MDKKKEYLVPLLLGAILLVATATFFALLMTHERGSEGLLGGSSDTVVTNFFSGENGTFNGNAFTFTPGLTYALETKYTTEHSLWVNCSDVNVTNLFYEVSPDNTLWLRGAVTMSGCLNNETKYDLTDDAFNYVRINVTANNGTVGALPNSSSKLMLMISGK